MESVFLTFLPGPLIRRPQVGTKHKTGSGVEKYVFRFDFCGGACYNKLK